MNSENLPTPRSTATSTRPLGLLLLHHPVHESITVPEMQAAIVSLGWGDLPIVPVKVEPARFSLAETVHANWGDLRRAQERLFVERVRPMLEEHPGYEVAYFGLAPVPLAVHLGSLVDRWRRSHAFQRHHTEHVWHWRSNESSPKVDESGVPQDVVRSIDDVVLRVSVTARVDPTETAKVVPLSSAEVDIALAQTGDDVLKTQADLESVGARVRDALDRFKTHRPNARRVHLFAAVPAGLAFHLGTLLSATQHHRVQTYQYFHTAEPKHQRAILLGESGPRRLELTDNDRVSAAEIRDCWAEEMSQVHAFGDHISALASQRPSDPWFSLVGTPVEPWGMPWRDLARFHETPLASSVVDLSATSIAEGFQYEGARDAWLVGDDLVAAICRRLEAADARKRAGRMLFFHEALHVQTHHLTEATATAIRRFPKILEDVDYQADVWAMLHEFAFTKHVHSEEAVNARALFLEIARTAVETMWAFDDGLDALERMEIRRVNRYLIWYWQCLHLERCTSLAEIATVLSRKPLIELAGPRVEVDGDRVFYQLTPPWNAELELAARLDHNAVVRHGSSAATDLPALMAGIRERNGQKIRLVLKGIVDQEVAR